MQSFPERLPETYEGLSRSLGEPPELNSFLDRFSQVSAGERAEVVLADQRQRFRFGRPVLAETYLTRFPDMAADRELKLQLVIGEFRCREESGETPHAPAFLDRFPDLRDGLLQSLGGLLESQASQAKSKESTTTEFDVGAMGNQEKPTQIGIAKNRPKRIGKYRIERPLGEGGFGDVYLAEDEDLGRWVAVKVLRSEKVGLSGSYLEEARMLAKLDHPGIVPVYDAGQFEGRCYIVSKFVGGATLRVKAATARPSGREAVRWVASIAEALHYAHSRGLVHRDVKPGNILFDARGEPMLIDFGLALPEELFGQGATMAGTPRYMSPEQAGGEGHLVDARSDVFSLGVVLYELLSGERPFPGDNQQEVLERIRWENPLPLSREATGGAVELERICSKALAKRARDRYDTAAAFAGALRRFLNGQASSVNGETEAPVIPKGLRSFEAHDADFFLSLLPGPYDTEGLPESIRFWKARAESNDAAQAFRIGLVYGPSGCGKSSWVKAGLLPRLSSQVTPVYLEATSGETEERLLRRLRSCCPQLPPEWELAACLRALRRGEVLAFNRKVLLILDQFEQWLHAHRGEDNTDLARALRQCDGVNVGCLLLVRDDFWLAVSRFFAELEIDLLQNQNAMLIDLFDRAHARKVLLRFGDSLLRWTKSGGGADKEQGAFLNRAVRALSHDGKVVPAHLALLVDLLKDKDWRIKTLKELHGAEGVGMWFLREMFEANPDPRFRHHEKAARAVLAALLPEPGNPLKGASRSYSELLEASEYSSREDDFQDLLLLLNGETRLVTPVAQPEAEGEAPTTVQRHYQLTHDFMVGALRDWLAAKQRVTWRGRAELRLAERATMWRVKPERRRLPPWWEWANILLLTKRGKRTETQRHMLWEATRYYSIWMISMLALSGFLGFGGREMLGQMQARMLEDQLLQAEISEAPAIAATLTPHRRWLDSRLASIIENSPEPAKRLRASLGLLPVDASQVSYLRDHLLAGSADEVSVIAEALKPWSAELKTGLWETAMGDDVAITAQRFRAACALAVLDSQSPHWSDTAVRDFMVGRIVVEPDNSRWAELLRSVSEKLTPELEDMFEKSSNETIGMAAASMLVTFFKESPERLADLIVDAPRPSLLPVFTRGLSLNDPAHRQWLRERLTYAPDVGAMEEEKARLARRAANSAAALVLLRDYKPVRPLLRHNRDPRVSSYLIEWFAEAGTDPALLVHWMREENDADIRRALLLSLGEMLDGFASLPQSESLLSLLTEIYLEDPDAGVHSAADWVLRKWGESSRLDEAKGALPRGVPDSESEREWFINSEGETFVMIDTRGHAGVGNGQIKNSSEAHVFALAATEVTVSQYARAFGDTGPAEECPECPVANKYYLDAVKYCLWLSRQDGIPEDEWCYQIAGNKVKVRPDFLSLAGYRLPTAVEWEVACRAGAVTSRPYGEATEMLSKYAWNLHNSQNSVQPVGRLKPNRWGFFDLLGNLAEWCEESSSAQWLATQAELPARRPLDFPEEQRWMRGGAFAGVPAAIEIDVEVMIHITDTSSRLGFRVARTISSIPSVSFPTNDKKKPKPGLINETR